MVRTVHTVQEASIESGEHLWNSGKRCSKELTQDCHKGKRRKVVENILVR